MNKVLLISLISLFGIQAFSQDVTLSMPTEQVAKNSSGTVEVMLNNLVPVSSLQLEFNYNSLQGISIGGASSINGASGHDATFTILDDSDPTNVRIQILLFTISNPAIAIGNEAILELNYSASSTANGATNLNVETLLVSNNVGQPITNAFTSGNLTVPTVTTNNEISFSDISVASESIGNSYALNLDNEDEVASMEVRFTYDKSKIQFNLSPTLTGRTTGFSQSVTEDDSQLNATKVVVLLFNLSSLKIPVGAGSILDFEFDVIDAGAEGDFGVDFQTVLFSDEASNALPSTFRNGTITILPTATVSIPTNLLVKHADNNRLKIAWDSDGTEDKFVLEKSINGGNFEFVDTVYATSYLDRDVLASTNYAYRVNAFSGSDFSDYSNTDDLTTISWEILHANSFDNHVIAIPSNLTTDINGVEIQAGDWIGLVYKNENDEERFMSAIFWEGINKSTTAWADNTFTSEKDGFTSGEKFAWKVMKGGQNLEVFAEYDETGVFNSTESFSGSGTSGLKELATCKKMNLELARGFNHKSIWVSPREGLDMAGIFSDVPDILVKDEAGLTKFWKENGGILQTSDWDTLRSYKMYLPQEVNVEICGNKINPQAEFSLLKLNYANYRPYLGQNTAVAQTALAGAMDKIQLVQVIRFENGFPVPYNILNVNGFFVDEIGSFEPTDGVKIAMKEEVASFMYPAGVVNKTKPTNYSKRRNPSYFIPEKGEVDLQNMVVLLPISEVDFKLENLDELAITNSDGKVVASAVYEDEKNALIFTIWKDNLNTIQKEGLTAGDDYNLILWSAKSDEETDLLFDSKKRFEVETIQILKSVRKEESSVQEPFLATIYPNPSNGKQVKLRLYSELESTVQITITDLAGKQMLSQQLFMQAGNNDVSVTETENLPTGIYLIRVEEGSKIHSFKLLVD
jgi:hypothetical protein